MRVRSAFGLLSSTTQVDARLPLRAYPRREQLRRLVQAHDTTPFSGSQVSRAKGEGIEFADIRPFAPGDRVRRVNWRASARRERMYVNESHPERASDVILFLDSFAEARGSSEGTLDEAVRAASSLADAYLERRNRVGLVSFGGTLRWLPPAMGMRQQYRIVDALIETELVRSYSSTSVDVIPRRVLPPQALVIALTPLLDQRTIGALLDLRARGFDLAVVDVSPVPYAADLPHTGDAGLAALDDVAEGAPSPVRTSRRSGRRVVDRAIAARRNRGGDGIQTSRASRLRLALIADRGHRGGVPSCSPRSWQRGRCAATSGSWPSSPWLRWCSRSPVWPRLLPWAIALLAGSVLVASEHGDIGDVGDRSLCGVAAARRRVRSDGGEPRAARATSSADSCERLVVRIAVETVAAGALAAAVLASASLGIPGRR